MTESSVKINTPGQDKQNVEQKIEITHSDRKPLKIMAESVWKWILEDAMIAGWKDISFAVAAVSWAIGWLYQIYKLSWFWMTWAFSAQQILIDAWTKGFPISVLIFLIALWWLIIHFYTKEHRWQITNLKARELEIETRLNPFEKSRHKRARLPFDWISGRFQNNPIRWRVIVLENIKPEMWRNRIRLLSIKKTIRIRIISLKWFVNENLSIPFVILPLTLLCVFSINSILTSGDEKEYICFSTREQSNICEFARIEYSNDKWTLISAMGNPEKRLAIPPSKLNTIELIPYSEQ